MRKVVMSAANTKRLVRLAFSASVAVFTLAACTTVEGTNALTDPLTFEREVVRPTLQGVGMVPQEQKQAVAIERSPLVVPAAGTTPPPPQQSVAQIPEDRSAVTINTGGLTTADLEALRTGRVIDANSVAGRPLTEAETRQLAARMQAYRQATGQAERSIYLPPAEYFTRVGNQNLICLAANGNLVAVNDPQCPPDVRAGLANR